MIELYFSTVKILAQRPTHISAVATVLPITKTFTVKYYYRRERERYRQTDRQTDRDRHRETERQRETEAETERLPLANRHLLFMIYELL